MKNFDYTVINNSIVMTRGDTHSFSLHICDNSDDDGKYTLQGNDAVYFGLMDPHQPFEHALVKKKFTSKDVDDLGNILITIKPEDTLDLFPGKYYYAVKLKIDHYDSGKHIESVDTIIQKTKFIICD